MTFKVISECTRPSTMRNHLRAFLMSTTLMMSVLVPAEGWTAYDSEVGHAPVDSAGSPRLMGGNQKIDTASPAAEAGKTRVIQGGTGASSLGVETTTQAAGLAAGQTVSSAELERVRKAAAPAPMRADGAPTLSDGLPPFKVAADSSQKGTMEGLQVHGHWVIDVKDPDGKLASHKEFENALSSSAQGILVGMITGQFVPGDLMIAMGAQSGNAPCTAVFQFCGLTRTLATSPATNYCTAYYCSANLTVTPSYGTLFSGPYSLVLSGSIVANQTGTIGTFYTIYSACSTVAVGTNPTSQVDISPVGCTTNTVNNWVGPLTAASITPISVASGQIVQVTVTLTFK